MRVVIDTSVLISAAIKAQTVPNAAVYQAEQRGVLLKSPVTEADLIEVIDRPYLAPLISSAARNRLVQLMARAEMITIAERIAACRDPKDNLMPHLIDCANAYCTEGEIVEAMASVYGRYVERAVL